MKQGSGKKNQEARHGVFRGPTCTAGLFVLCIAAVIALCLIAPAPTRLEIENRRGASLPAFEFSALRDGSWAEDMETYAGDRFCFRESWIDAQCFIDEALFCRQEHDGILLGSGKRMFTKTTEGSSASYAQLRRNTAAVRAFAEKSTVPVTMMIVPSASLVYADDVPNGAPLLDENAALDKIFRDAGPNVRTIDLRREFSAHADEYLYYRTDHHWTTHGAFLACRTYLQSVGRTLYGWETLGTAKQVRHFRGTHYAKTRLWNADPDTITYYENDAPMTVFRVKGDAQFEAKKTGPLVNRKKFRTYDKYAAFLDGNNGYSTVRGTGTGSILVVKDSYANCFVPLLTKNYADIGVVDYRKYAYGLDTLVKSSGYDEVLILYSFDAFLTDTGVPYIAR